MFRGSTEHVFSVALPQLIQLEGLLRPDVLTFHVPLIYPEMMAKARWYVDNKDTHIKAIKLEDDSVAYLLLRKDNALGAKTIDKKLHGMWEAAHRGEKDSRIVDEQHLMDVCGALHVVLDPTGDYEVPACEGNPCKFDCVGCKGMRQTGICSHTWWPAITS